jgi:energy-coupling factor transport system substrate-specific component
MMSCGRSEPKSVRTERTLSGAILALASLLGLGAFLYPFFLPNRSGAGMAPALSSGAGAGVAHADDAPLIFVLLLVLCLVAVLTAMTGRQMTSKLVALLGILTALNAMLRTIPGPAGFSAMFLLPILAGYCYGPTFGFLLGALSLLVSAFIGGGVGPWMPYQMFSAGWVGMLSGWLPELRRHPRVESVVLAAWGGVLGFIFGALMNIWFWPFLAGGGAQIPGTTWQPGMTVTSALRSYLVFYVVTSLWWDLARAAGNALLLLLFGGAILRVLRRFRGRFRFDLAPETAVLPAQTVSAARGAKFPTQPQSSRLRPRPQ